MSDLGYFTIDYYIRLFKDWMARDDKSFFSKKRNC